MASRSFREVAAEIKASDPNRTDPPAVGKYTATLVSASVRETNAGGKFMLNTKWQVDSGPETGKTVWNRQTYDPTVTVSVSICLSMFDAMGVNSDEMDHLDFYDGKAVLEYVAEKAKGSRNQIVVVADRVYKDEKQFEVKFVNRLPKDAPPKQQAQATAGINQVAAASTPKPAKADGPPKPYAV